MITIVIINSSELDCIHLESFNYLFKFLQNFGDECNEKTQWFNEMPYYAHLPERQPAALIKIVDYIFRIILPIAFLIICILYFVHYAYLNKS